MVNAASQTLEPPNSDISMKSDHWNFLANLLGTPGPAKSQEGKKPKAEKSAEKTLSEPIEEPHVDDSGESANDVDSPPSTPSSETTQGEESDLSIDAQHSSTDASDGEFEKITREDVLGALVSTAPPKTLPGFGAGDEDSQTQTLDQLTGTNMQESVVEVGGEATSDENMAPELVKTSQEEDSKAAGTEIDEEAANTTEESGSVDTWGDLASEIGFTPSEESQPIAPINAEAETDSKPKTKRSTNQKSRRASASKRSGSGFGEGLGFDSAEEPESPSEPMGEAANGLDSSKSEADQLDTSNDDSVDLPGGWATFSSGSDENDHQEQAATSTLEEVSGETKAEGTRGPKTDRRRRFRDKEGDGENRRKRTRSRRDDNDRRGNEQASDEREEATETSQRRGHNDREEKRSRDSEGESRSRRSRGRRGARQRITEDDARLIDEEMESNRESREEGSSSEARGGRRRGRSRSEDQESTASNQEVRRRSRRSDSESDDRENEGANDSRSKDEEGEFTGRGRRRGRRGRGGRNRKDGDAATNQDPVDTHDPLERASAFDDDHEDDQEVAEIRRGQRSRSRNRDEDQSEVRGENRGRRRRRSEDSDNNETERVARKRPEREPETSRESKGRRTSIPSWLETVDLLVNANIENHKKSKGGRGKGGKKR